MQIEMGTGGVGQREREETGCVDTNWYERGWSERRGYEDRNGYGWGGSKTDREERV